MAENYKEFDKSPIVDTSDVVLKGFRFRVRELALAIAVLVCLLVIIILAALLGAANSKGSNDNGEQSSALNGVPCDHQCFTPDCFKTAAHVTELINTTADPCNDFHNFACGKFPSLHPLVPFENEMTTFQLIYDQNQDRLRRLLEQKLDPQKNLPMHYERKLKHFFESCLDHFSKMQEQGRPLLEKMIQPSGGWWVLDGEEEWGRKSYDFQSQLRKVHVDYWTDAFFTFSLITDWLDWTKMTIQIDLSGIGIPYTYFYNDQLKSNLDDYKAYIREVGGLLMRDSNMGDVPQREKNSRLDTFVNDVFFVESELAKLKRDSNPTENPHATENRVKLSDLDAAGGNAVNFVELFSYMFNDVPSVGGDTTVVVLEKEYVNKFGQWINNLPANNKTRILNSYLVWRLADTYDQDLSWDYIHANRDIYVDITGQAEFLGTWRYCVYRVDRDMKEALGALFVQNHFSEENKRTAQGIMKYVKSALVDSLRNSKWMSSTTKETAIKKINESIAELGYPTYMTQDSVLNQHYAVLNIGDDYFESLVSFAGWFRKRWNDRLKAPMDRSVWPYATYDFVAHYYSPWKELFIPAGLLQFPIYDHKSPRYTNYGSMGTILGRQLTHAVDEYGNYYKLDGTGLGPWWSTETTQRYQELKQCIIDAYKDIVLGPYITTRGSVNIKVDANYYAPLALGESSSVRLAYMAYHNWMDTTGGEKSMPGAKYNNDQMFFISYAQTYCRTTDPVREYSRVTQTRIPPEKVRVNYALAHVPEFQRAFQCKATSHMVAPKRCNFF